ncbi:MAG: hypothetical protein Q4B23_00955 [Helcococcus sp.]|nr:hypothetical protein [Helcococcus sp.]
MKRFEKALFVSFILLLFLSSFTFLFYKSFDLQMRKILLLTNIVLAVLFFVSLLIFEWKKRKGI